MPWGPEYPPLPRMASMAHRGEKRLPEPLTTAEVRALLAAFNGGWTGDRNRALVAVLARAGLRLGEALALVPSDLDPRARSVRVRRGKRSRWRVVGMDPEAFALVRLWLVRRGELGLSGPLFCTRAGGPLSDRYVRQALANAGRRAGIARPVRPHGLRHTLAAYLKRQGVELQVIQAQLGQASLDATAHYLGAIAPDPVQVMADLPPWLEEDEA